MTRLTQLRHRWWLRRCQQLTLGEEDAARFVVVKIVFCEMVGPPWRRSAEQPERQFVDANFGDKRGKVLFVAFSQNLHVRGGKAVLELLVEGRLKVAD